MPARLKHVYSAITLSSNDLTSIAWLWATFSDPLMRANAYHLQSMDELAEVLREDQVVDTLSILSQSGDQQLSLTYETGYVLIEASDEDPRLLAPFTAAAELLAAKVGNGYAQCLIEASPAGTWRAPAWTAPKTAEPVAKAPPVAAAVRTAPQQPVDVARPAPRPTWRTRLAQWLHAHFHGPRPT